MDGKGQAEGYCSKVLRGIGAPDCDNMDTNSVRLGLRSIQSLQRLGLGIIRLIYNPGWYVGL